MVQLQMATFNELWSFRLRNNNQGSGTEWCAGGSFVLRRSIILGGFMGVGKSTVGQILARGLKVLFLDMDALLSEKYGPINDQFERDGEQVFRAREHTLLEQLKGREPCVIASGGGVWVQPENQGLLREHFHRVVLEADLETIRQRIEEDKQRPLWNEDVERLYRERTNAYQEADFRVNTQGNTADGVAKEIYQWLVDLM